MSFIFQEETISHIDQLEGDNTSSTFEDILDEYFDENPYESPKRGQILEGEIEAIDDHAIILDVGLKRDAIIPSREINSLDDDDFSDLSVGDVIPIQVTQTPVGDQDLIVSFDQALSYQSWQNAQNCLENDQLLRLKVIESNRGGILVEYEKLEGFVPNSHIPALRNIYAPNQIQQSKQRMEGSEINVIPIEVNPREERLIFSALEAQRSERLEQLKKLEVGQIIIGKVVNVVQFGVFVDLGGINGLVHNSELDWLTISNPFSVATVGDEMPVQIIGIDPDRERIQLSRKALLPDPWDDIESQFVTGSLVEVEITNVVDFGAFAKLSEGIRGLIHSSELGYTIPAKTEEVVQPGNKVLVKIIQIEAERKRISLSMQKVSIEKQLDWMVRAQNGSEKTNIQR